MNTCCELLNHIMLNDSNISLIIVCRASCNFIVQNVAAISKANKLREQTNFIEYYNSSDENEVFRQCTLE